MPTRHPRLRLVTVSLLALATVITLVAERPAFDRATWQSGDELAVAIAWAVAIAAATWLFAATAACVAVLGFRRPALARRLAPALPFGVRRLVELAIVTSCVAGSALPAHAAPAPAAVVAVDQPVVRSVPTETTVAPTPTTTTTAAPDAPSAAAASATAAVVVKPGDSLWRIARAELTGRRGRTPSDRELVPYWRALIEANRATLRSGNPSLVFPGEIVTLPAVPPVP